MELYSYDMLKYMPLYLGWRHFTRDKQNNCMWPPPTVFRAIMVVNKCMCMLDDRVYHSSSRGQYCFPTVGGPREQKFFLESQFIPIDGYVW